MADPVYGLLLTEAYWYFENTPREGHEGVKKTTRFDRHKVRKLNLIIRYTSKLRIRIQLAQ